MLLPSLRVENYRAFDHLEIERLGRVNLFVGRNNSGKSSLLEAVRIFASQGSLSVLWDILADREEITGGDPSEEQIMAAFDHLFRGREGSWDTHPGISIGPFGSPLHISTTVFDGFSSERRTSPEPVIDIAFLGEPLGYTFKEINRRRRMLPQPSNSQYVGPSGLDSVRVAKLWDTVALTASEDDVTAALRLVSPDIERMSIIGNPRTTVMVKLTGYPKPVPLRSLGDGVNRVLGITLAVVNAGDGGVVTIDEIENGLHYAVQRRLWDLIFITARRLNVQVFATTHSWDCIQSFQQAAAADPHEEALLIRLESRKGRIQPIVVPERELSILAREQIEVR